MDAPTRMEWRNAMERLIDAERALQRAEDARDKAMSDFLKYQPPLNTMPRTPDEVKP